MKAIKLVSETRSKRTEAIIDRLKQELRLQQEQLQVKLEALESEVTVRGAYDILNKMF